jgi:membrane protein YdbS with pleckstrin-like domain
VRGSFFGTILSLMSYLDDHLLGGERIVYRARLHWTIFLTSIVVVLLGIGLWILLRYIDPRYSYAGLGLAGIGLLLAIGPAIRHVTSEFAVTDKRVLGKVGFIERESDETLLSKIEAIAVDQGIVARMFGFGTVMITGTGGTQERFSGISNPLEFRRQIQSQIIAQEERRGGPAGAVGSGQPRVERECPYCAEPILARARVCKHCGREVVPTSA